MKTDIKYKDDLKIISSTFKVQLEEGLPNKKDDQIKYIGQFFDCNSSQGVSKIDQYGLHGTAAALNVVSFPLDEKHSNGLINGLSSILDKESNHNVIKLSEALISLTLQPRSNKSALDLSVRIYTLLNESKKDRGWGYFSDSESQVNPLPTSFAVRAISCYKQSIQDLRGEVEYLDQTLKEEVENKIIGKASFDKTILINILYNLEYTYEYDNSINRKLIVNLYKSYKKLFDRPVEQNIEFWNGKVSYIRIPWQIHLIVLTREHYKVAFCSKRVRIMIKYISKSLNDKNVIYPDSGNHISTRTYSIIYEAFSKLSKKENKWYFEVLYYFDLLKELLKDKKIRTVLNIVLIAFGVYFTFSFLNDDFDAIKAKESLFYSLLPSWLFALIQALSKDS